MAGALTAAIAAAFSGSAVVSDPYFEYTTLLLPGNGTNGAQNNTFLDGSTNNFTITRNGNTTQGTFSPFSQTGWGNYFNGSSYLVGPTSNATMDLGTGAYTIEGWVYLTAYAGSGNESVIFCAGNANNSIAVSVLPTGALNLSKYGTGTVIATSANEILLNTWYHVAVSRASTASNDTKLYVNGVLKATGTDNNNWNINTTPTVGALTVANFNVNGYLSNVRVVKGVAVYTGAFTPPILPLTATQSAGTNIAAITGTQTSLLTCQSNRFRDASNNNLSITTSGSPTVVAFSPFNPTASWSAATYGGSGYFDGNGDYLSTNYTFNWSTYGSYTLEFWVYHTTMAPTNQWYFVGGTGGTGNTLFYNYSNGKVGLGINGTNEIASATGVIKANTWQHVAYTYNGTTTKIYVDGVEVASGTTAVYANSSVAMSVGGGSSSSLTVMNGYMANLRLSQSVIYTTAFTPPTSPVTGGALLLNFTNAGIYDATSKNDLETVGNAQISTTQSKWGGSSMAFDGTGDYLLNNNAVSDLLAFGSGDFTIEMWVRFASITTGVYTLYDARPSGTQGAYASIALDQSTAKIYYYVSSAIRITATNTVSANTWYHIALCRSGTSTKLFINGTQEGSTWTDTTTYLNPSVRPSIGASGSSLGSEALNGYLQDVRITKGYARYTANFTAPTAAFPTL